MKYIFKCPSCGETYTLQLSISQYEGIILHCDNDSKHKKEGNIRLERVYSPNQVSYRGEGFTGAAGSTPQMNKEKRKKDLASPSDAEKL